MSNDQPPDINEEINCKIQSAETFINTFFKNSNTTLADIDEKIKYLESIKIDDADLQTKLSYWIVLDKMKALHAYIDENRRNEAIDETLREMLVEVEESIETDENDIDALKEFERNISSSHGLFSQKHCKGVLDMINDHIKVLKERENNGRTGGMGG